MSMRLNNLAVTHHGATLVEVADLDFERGYPVTIVGESGSGKSLLAHAIMGTLPAALSAEGSLVMDGQAYNLAEPGSRRKLWGPVMSLLPQEPMLALDPTMRARDQIAEGARSFTADRRSARQAAGTLLASLGLGHATGAFPHTLSGGMAQRVAFAAATIGGAPVLIADEPSKGLDDRARAELAGLLRRHIDGGGILLTITHDLDLAREIGGDVLVMKDAHIIEQGPAVQVLTEPAHPYTRRLLAAEPSNWQHPWMTAPAPLHETARALVRGEGLAKAFGGQNLFSDLSLAVHPGERLSLSGPSGSGKTTLGNVLLRLLPSDAGRVHHADTLQGGRVQKLYQDPALAFPSGVPLRDSLGDVIRRHRLDPERLEELMASLRLAPVLLTRRPGEVSGGELQRLAIIRSMLLEPALLFADEPTSRLDLITQEETICCLMEQVGRHRCALVLVTHDNALADAVSHRSILLGTGEKLTKSANSFA
ncbi:peptide/nickel transport system ATP-binding protein [Arthrobacter sp. V4I6]|uniref:ABC transporter ATP-binding protein n=1 Tax=unclassified Arthrobacter TaxID=235627 RepID=UPI002782007E|nr:MULTISPECIES: ATP-binding cassette domain-containing protein [unclassified Arthrobacter]MDQ0819587.1 peptide/nickel transport system ATP-binding protein [Arthrobacter sp. V1I7]MDQ0853766.1 peptide/nickel transport system ATP-binding protein [Arthrobacter sp. V4I6]